ncbi:MAG TPA: peroxiredoxin [Polyangiaceae bacterium]|nr:peroxiredoxin [Polyangiaceae bacterium]
MTRRTALLLVGGVLAAGGIAAATACANVQRPDGGEGHLAVGTPAPDVEGVDQNGEPRSVADARGQFLIVYFYPKDGTPGCTAEACAFRDAWQRFEEAGVMIYGVSGDDQASHAEFAEEHDLPFPLIADPSGTWSRHFGVGTFLGMTERVSFVIDPEGVVVARYPDVDPGVHANQVLADIDKLR